MISASSVEASCSAASLAETGGGFQNLHLDKLPRSERRIGVFYKFITYPAMPDLLYGVQ